LVLVRFRWEAALESGKSKQDETEIRAVWGATSVGLGETSGIFLSAILTAFRFQWLVLDHRMCRHFGWIARSDDRNHARDDFKDALVKEFYSIYGTDEHDLSSWQGLCGILGIPLSERLEGVWWLLPSW
jgi:hypothetical protein